MGRKSAGCSNLGIALRDLDSILYHRGPLARARDVRWSDIEAAAKARDPQLADLVINYMEAGDPPEDRPEDADPSASAPALPDGSWTMQRLRTAVGPGAMAHKTDDEKRATRRAAWDALLAAPHPPPRLQLGDLMVELYEAGDEPGMDALRTIVQRSPIGWGFWQGFKRIFKLVEERHDVAMFGLLAWRLDTSNSTRMKAGEVTRGTLVYMRRRAWRFLRQLGTAVPEAYPQFAVEVLRHYDTRTRFYECWVAPQIWAHEHMIGLGQGGFPKPSDDMKHWAFPDAWKRAPEPLLRLLEHAEADEVCRFAIIGLTKAHPDSLRELEPEWLRRLGEKPLPAVHDFIVDILGETPKFHPSKLADVGLHDLVINLLESPSANARTYALTYARAHAPKLETDRLVRLAIGSHGDVSKFAVERLEKLGGREIGLPGLVRLMSNRGTATMADKKIRESFRVADLSVEEYTGLATGGGAAEQFVDKWYADAKSQPPAKFLIALLEDSRLSRYRVRLVMDRLRKRPARDIGLDWIKQALLDRRYTATVTGWLGSGLLQGPDVDLEWFKELLARPKLRGTALTVLGNPKWVDPKRLDSTWLLGLLRHSDPDLRRFARRQLLEHLPPTGELPWKLLSEPGQPETVREFAAAYLKVHHPELGPQQAEARDLGIEPKLSHDAYGQARVEPLLSDPRADVRRVAGEIASAEVKRWGDAGLAYRLASNRYPEPRKIGGEILLRLGEPDVAPERALPTSWLSVDAVFALAESPNKSTREVALSLVRRHYARLGGAERLAWLMESPDREVRLFAVRLLWDEHRPKSLQPVEQRAEEGTPSQRFDAPEAVREFLKTVLFGLPPGRMERRVHGDSLPDRALPASVAKARLVGVVRDFALEDVDFARVVQPVLESFMHSQARGERDACVAAMASIREAHPGLIVDLPRSTVEIRKPKRPRFGAEPIT